MPPIIGSYVPPVDGPRTVLGGVVNPYNERQG